MNFVIAEKSVVFFLARLKLQNQAFYFSSDENEKANLLASIISTVREPTTLQTQSNVILNEREVMSIKQQVGAHCSYAIMHNIYHHFIVFK